MAEYRTPIDIANRALGRCGVFGIVAFAFLMLVACDGSDSKPKPVSPVWEIGPVIGGKNYSTGSVVDNVITVADVHYVTRLAGPLSGAVRLSFHLSAPLTGTGCGAAPATATLYFQREGDDWNTDGWRWWATFATVILDHPGDYSMTASFNGPWTSVEHDTAITNPQDFADAKAHAARVGFTLGNCTGYGHGGTGNATITITDFAVN